MERRVLIAVVLSFLVLYAFQTFIIKPPPRPQETAAEVTPSSGLPAEQTAPGAARTPTVSSEPAAESLVGDTAERDVRIETPHVVAVFSNRGARLKSWQLKAYRDRAGEPLELVATDLAATHPLPFSLRVPDEIVTTTLNGVLYAVRGAPGPGDVQREQVTIAFEYRDSSGLRAEKQFRLDPASYTVGVRVSAWRGDQALAPSIEWGPGLGDHDAQGGKYSVQPAGIYSVAGSVTRLAADDLQEQPSYEDAFEYAGVDDHYFMSAALKPGRSKLTYQIVPAPAPAGSTEPARQLVAYSLQPQDPGSETVFYVGPKDLDTLAAIDTNLVKAIHFGMFSVIVVPLLRSLNWIHHYVGNYGWSIVLLTLLINLVLFPLNHKSVVSMRKMQEIQPEAKAIQERYAKLKTTDPAKQKMNQELMALYRERGVNPASGCIPILLTLPVFLAFYALLTTAIELRGAPFFGWIHDLSQPDPYYVTPVLVGVSQVLTQWMTPQAGVDPTQQKLMLIMPIVLIFVFISTPAGALIYWFIGNIWRVGQQALTNYLIGPPNIRTIRPAAERRVKRAGAGKSEGAARES